MAGCGDISEGFQAFCEQTLITHPENLEGAQSSCKQREDCCQGFDCVNGTCQRTEAIAASVPCGRDQDCETGQCLGGPVTDSTSPTRYCREAEEAHGPSGPCVDQTDCKGTLVCQSGSCGSTSNTGPTQPGMPCEADNQCTSGQCSAEPVIGSPVLARTCAQANDQCVQHDQPCADATDCCGALRCGPGGRCIRPEWRDHPGRACYPFDTACMGNDLCCDGSCNPQTGKCS